MSERQELVDVMAQTLQLWLEVGQGENQQEKTARVAAAISATIMVLARYSVEKIAGELSEEVTQ